MINNAQPENVGLSSKRLSRIDTVINEHVASGKMPGMVALIARHGKVAYFKTFGKMDIAVNKVMTNDAVFRIASMTKAITSVGVMMLYEEGNIRNLWVGRCFLYPLLGRSQRRFDWHLFIADGQ